jgi:hypothetical protein
VLPATELRLLRADLVASNKVLAENAQLAANETAALRANTLRMEAVLQETIEELRSYAQAQCKGLCEACVELEGGMESMEFFVNTSLFKAEEKANLKSDLVSVGLDAGHKPSSNAVEELKDAVFDDTFYLAICQPLYPFSPYLFPSQFFIESNLSSYLVLDVKSIDQQYF